MASRRLVLVESGNFELQEVETPGPPQEGHALVRVSWVGVSGTEMLAIHQRLPGCKCPQVLGMHLAGKVIAVGPGHRSSSDDGDGRWPIEVGSAVVVDPFLVHPHGSSLRGSEPIVEILGIHVAGGMQDHLVLPVQNLHATAGPYSKFHIPSDMFPLIAGLAEAIHTCRRGSMKCSDLVMVIGQGPLALGTCLYASSQGNKVLLYVQADSVNDTITVAMARVLPAVQTLSGTPDRTPDETLQDVLRMTNNQLPDLIVDTTGEAELMKMPCGFLAFKGRLVYAGYFHGQVNVPSSLIYARELTILAARHAEVDDYKEAIRIVESEEISAQQLQVLVSHRCEIEQFAASSHAWSQPEAQFLFGLVRMGDV